MKTKKCIKCGKEKDINEFPTHNTCIKTGKKLHRGSCKICWGKYNKEYRLKNKEQIRISNKIYNAKPDVKKHKAKMSKQYSINNKKKMQDQYFMKNYNITLEERDRMLVLQDYTCGNPGCNVKHSESKNKRLVVDHEHSTGESETNAL